MLRKMTSKKPSGAPPAKMDLYWMEPSPPSRAVLTVVKALGLKPTLHRIDLMKGEHLTEEYKKVNPLGKVPTLIDGGMVLTESRAILTYLLDKYSKDDALYPRDAARRAKVNMRLNWDLGSFYSSISAFAGPQVLGGQPADPAKEDVMKKYLNEFEEVFLRESKFVTGDKLTVADYSMACSVTFLELLGYDLSPWKRLGVWLERVKGQPAYKEANAPYEQFKQSMAAASHDTPDAAPAPAPEAAPVSLDFYWFVPSPPCRAVYVAFKALGLEPSTHVVDVFKAEQKTPEFLAINPFGKIPAIVDGDLKLAESRAILMYLAEKYGGEEDGLYPREPARRARLQMLLNWEMAVFYAALARWISPILFEKKESDPEAEAAMKSAFSVFEETVLQDQPFAAGDAPTIVDISMATGLMQLELVNYDVTGNWPKMAAWLERVRSLPFCADLEKEWSEFKAGMAAQ